MEVPTLKKTGARFAGIFSFKREFVFTWEGLLAVRFRQFVCVNKRFDESDFGSAQDTIGSAQLMIGSARALSKV